MIMIVMAYGVLALSAVYFLTFIRAQPKPVCYLFLGAAEMTALAVACGLQAIFWAPLTLGMLLHLAWRRTEAVRQFVPQRKMT